MELGPQGPGHWLTVYANPGHAYMVIAGLRLDTSMRDDPSPHRAGAGASACASARLHGPPPARLLSALLTARSFGQRRPRALLPGSRRLRDDPRRVSGLHGRSHPYTEKTDEQKAITEMVRQFVDKEVLPIAEEYDHEDKFPDAVVEQMKELGLFGVTIPEEYGGMGLDLTTYAMIVEELSRGWISVSGIVNTHFIGSYLLMKFGTDEQKREVPAAHGDRRDPRRLLALRARVRLGRAGASSPPPPSRTTATGSMNGQKMWVTNGLRVGPGVRAGEDRPEGRARLQGHDLLHHREGAG